MQFWVRQALCVSLLFAIIAIAILYALNWEHLEVVLPIAGVFILCGFYSCRRRYHKASPIVTGGACRVSGFNINQVDRSWCNGSSLSKVRWLQLHPDRNFDCPEDAQRAFQNAQNQCERIGRSLPTRTSAAPTAAPTAAYRSYTTENDTWWEDYGRESQENRAREAKERESRENQARAARERESRENQAKAARERESQRPVSAIAELLIVLGVMGNGMFAVGELAFMGAGVLGELAFTGVGALGKLALAGTLAGVNGIADGVEVASAWMLGDD